MEINTAIETLEKLKKTDISSYDAVYLGDPFSLEYPENMCLNLGDLAAGVEILKSEGKKAYVTTFSVPRNKDLPAIEKMLRFVKEKRLAVDMIEAHNTGVLKMVNEIQGDMPVAMGCLSNIYTDSTVELLKKFGVVRVTGSYELSLGELLMIRERCSVEVEVLVQGRMVLGVSEECPARVWFGDETPEGFSDAELCRRVIELKAKKMQLAVTGRVTLSGRDVCMMEHLPELVLKGMDVFRIGGPASSWEYLSKAGQYYRDVLRTIEKAEIFPEEKVKDYMADLRRFNPNGFCNGYYYSTSGSEYVPAGAV